MGFLYLLQQTAHTMCDETTVRFLLFFFLSFIFFVRAVEHDDGTDHRLPAHLPSQIIHTTGSETASTAGLIAGLRGALFPPLRPESHGVYYQYFYWDDCSVQAGHIIYLRLGKINRGNTTGETPSNALTSAWPSIVIAHHGGTCEKTNMHICTPQYLIAPNADARERSVS